MATIVTKNSSTASSVPSSSDLVEGELAVNTADKRLFTENASAAVVELGTNPSTVTTTTVTTTNLVAGGLTYVTSDGSANQVLATNGSGALQWLTVSGVYDLATQAEAEAGTVTGGKIFSPLRVKQAIDALATTAGADIASATTVDLTAATGNTVVITGTTTTTALTMNTGQQMILLPSAAWPMTFHATTMNIMGGVSYTCAAGDRVYAVKDLAGVIRVSVFKQDGTAVVTGSVAVGDITGLASGVSTFLATSSSANLASAVTDETGSGSLVFATSPTLVTPALGTPSSGTLTNATGLPAAGVVGTAAILGANTFTALQTQAAGADIASATTVDLTAATGNVVVITGTTTTTALTMTKGQQMTLIAAAAWPLTFHATTMNINGGVSYTCAAGDRLYVVKDDDDVIRVSVTKQDGTAVVVESAGPSYEATASGALANGDTVIVNSNGTVSAVSGSGASENLGSGQVVDSNARFNTQSIYDTQNDKLIIFYRNSSTGYLVGRVCSVSGDTISAGAEQTVYADANPTSGQPGNMSYAYIGSGKFVFMANDASIDGGVSAVGSVSGTTITMGTVVQFGDNANNVEKMSIVYDENAGKVVAFWAQDASPNHSFAAVGTISGTTLSYGTPVTVTTDKGWFYPDSVVYDSTAQKLVCCYVAYNASEHGKVRVGTVSGTSITFGTEATFRSATIDKVSATYDPDEDKTIVFFRDSGSGYDLRASVLTVSGTGVTASTDVTVIENQAQDICSVYDTNANKTVVQFRDVEQSPIKTKILVLGLSGTTITLDSELSTAFDFENDQCQISFDSDTNKVIICGSDTDNSTYPTAAVYTAAFSNSNITAENYIGISDGAYSDGDTATIQIAGSVDDAQSSLTAGQTYYVSYDGSLNLTPVDPSVTAGTAVSATKIIVKG